MSSVRRLTNQNQILEKAQAQAEKNMDIIQDATALDQEIEYQQQQLQDIISQQTSKMTEGLEDEYDQLDELEMFEAMNKYENQQAPANKNVIQPEQVKAKPENNYDKLLADLLN
jgi:hypothetical protein